MQKQVFTEPQSVLLGFFLKNVFIQCYDVDISSIFNRTQLPCVVGCVENTFLELED